MKVSYSQRIVSKTTNVLWTNFMEQMKGKEMVVNPSDHKLLMEGTRSIAEKGV